MGYKAKGGVIFNDTVVDETKFSDEIDISHCEGVSLRATITGGSLSGSYVIQASVDGLEYLDTSNTRNLPPAGEDVLFNLSDLYYSKLRVKITTSNANPATVKIVYFMKGI